MMQLMVDTMTPIVDEFLVMFAYLVGLELDQRPCSEV